MMVSRHELTGAKLSTLAETVAVTTCSIAVIKLISIAGPDRFTWLITPAVLVVSALITTMISGRKLTDLGLCLNRPAHSLRLLLATCLIAFGAMFAALWLMKALGLEIPLRPTLPEGRNLLYWILYQFLYIAVAEELFFRGYLQTNLSKIARKTNTSAQCQTPWLAIVISAAVFAASHIVITDQNAAILTFAPGIILGWLFARTRSLLAPILFHAMANVFYCLAITALT